MMESAGKVLMFVENSYPNDVRVKNEADALTEAGYAVTVVALRKPGQTRSEVVDRVQVYRLPRLELFQKTPSENPTFLDRVWLKIKSLLGYVSEYAYFTGACFMMSLYVAYRHGFDVIHAHNPPDTLWLAALPWRLIGKKYVFDHHDLCPELYRSRYGTRMTSSRPCCNALNGSISSWPTSSSPRMNPTSRSTYSAAAVGRKAFSWSETAPISIACRWLHPAGGSAICSGKSWFTLAV
jgi:hypothetical protein